MIKKICPVCDKEMKSARYCEFCRSWVKKPIIRNVTYRLNESHLQNEKDCSYHQRGSTMANQVPQQANQTTQRPNQTMQRSDQAAQRPGPVTQQTNPGPQSAPRSASASQMPSPQYQPVSPNGSGRVIPARRRHPFRTIFFTLILLSLTRSVVSSVIRLNSSSSKAPAEVTEDVDLGAFTPEENNAGTSRYDMAFEELSDEEVLDAGAVCSLYGHFKITAKQMEPYVMRLMAENGVQISETHENSYNQRYEDGMTWYTTWKTYYIVPDYWTEDDFYICIDGDTASEALHEVYGFVEHYEQAVNITIGLLEVMEEYHETDYAMEENGITVEAITESIDDQGYFGITHEELQIYLEPYGEGYDFYISKSTESNQEE